MVKPLPTHLIAYDEHDEQYLLGLNPGLWIGRIVDPENEPAASLQPMTLGLGEELVLVDIQAIRGPLPTDGDLRAAAAWYDRMHTRDAELDDEEE